MLLIVVAIGMMIYYFQLNPIDFKIKRLQKQDPDTYPWVQDWRLVGQDQLPQQPEASQPQITENIYFETRPKKDNQSRGKILFQINHEGIVIGNWTGEYDTRSPPVSYAIMKGEFQGNIDPTKIYADDQGRDPSKLFFIAKGTYLMLVSNHDTGKTTSPSGYIYVTGWLDNEFSVTGKVTISPNRKNLETFNFAARPQ